MRIRVFDTPDAAAAYAVALVEQTAAVYAEPVLGLATGGTMIPFYKALVQAVRQGLDLSRAWAINLDEYVGLGAEHPQSCAGFMREHLYRHVPWDGARAHIPDGCAPDLAAECRRYDRLLATHPVHLQFLGIGLNGHIGFNEPGDELVAETHLVELSETTIRSNARFFRDPGEVPRRAITMGVGGILRAERVVLLAFGEQKAEVVARALTGPITTRLPASLLQLHRDVTVLLDTAAAQKIRGKTVENG
ncbi:glucosamine-6-phosphate deaminase [Alicyclobacillus cellulosilyticus]|uniref:Glucosamine-6-phosphate deaminase n=1 Tax=Alicyclobacillus cellulosilyticus TaxID=1003997 RepID=A0A917K9V6_9BACL|nr:glucosamine-6-phosphate deaminase [Alicyclobacillus cellulosilyticus]GGJ02616.1 glucosamine-6-phosphate deaminase [Alicyclobacillus cellulosilyticus]